VAPVERIKILRMTNNARYLNHGYIQTLMDIKRTDGIRAWYKGHGTNMVRIVPHGSMQFFFFDMNKKFLVQNLGLNE
jgi:hypothetical protein